MHSARLAPPSDRCQAGVRISQVLSDSVSLNFRLPDFPSPAPLLTQSPGPLSRECAHGDLLLFPWRLIIYRGCAQRYKEIIRRAGKLSLPGDCLSLFTSDRSGISTAQVTAIIPGPHRAVSRGRKPWAGNQEAWALVLPLPVSPGARSFESGKWELPHSPVTHRGKNRQGLGIRILSQKYEAQIGGKAGPQSNYTQVNHFKMNIVPWPVWSVG